MSALNFSVHQWLRSWATAAGSVKVMLFFIAWVLLWLPIAIPLAWRLNWHPLKPLVTEQKLPLLASLYLIAPVIIWGVISVEGKFFSDYGLIWQPKFFFSLLLGLAIAIFTLALVFVPETLLGWIEWDSEQKNRLWPSLFPLLALGLWIGVTEEFIFRGFVLNELSQDTSVAIAAFVSSAIFAISHLIWDRKETLPQLPGLLLMGIILVLARWVDNGSLGLASGLHAGWIWGLSSLDSADLISYTGKGSKWITGVGENPLAGLAGISCLLITGGILWWGWL